MPSHNHPLPRFFSLDPGGQHVLATPVDLEGLVLRMPNISEVKVAYDVYKPTPPMADLASHLRRLTHSSEDGLCYSHACCDISNAWNEVGAAGKARVLSGVSARGGTLVLLFAPIQHHDDYVVEVNCRY